MHGGRDEDSNVSAATQQETPVPGGTDLEALFAAHHARVLQAAYRVTGNAGDAEDVLQTVFLRLVRREEAVLEPSPEAYLYRAAVNAALDLLRSRRRGPSVPLEDAGQPRAGAGADPEELRRGREIEAWLRDAVGRLAPQSAEVFALHVFEGRSHEEIAEALGLSRNAVAVVLHRARRQLKRELAALEGEIR
jgi:RNA polymerase sigma-70 factor, ECF subfamily